jgi:hypothetical protein
MIRRIERGVIKMYICLRIKYPLFMSDFKESLTFLNGFSKNTEISNFIKVRPVGAEFHADRRTDGQT